MTNELKEKPITPDTHDGGPKEASNTPLIEQLLKEIAELRAKVDGQSTIPSHLPANAFYGGDGLLYHKIQRTLDGGSTVLSTRRLATSAEEARDQRIDFYHPSLGLIWEGYKLASDRTTHDILNDSSIGGQIPPGEHPPEFGKGV